MGRDGDDARVGADEFFEVGRIAAGDVVSRIVAQQRRFEHPHACRHVARRSVAVVFDVAPLGILLVENAFQPHRQRRHAHLNEVAGVVDDLGERCRQDDAHAARGRAGSRRRRTGRSLHVVAIP